MFFMLPALNPFQMLKYLDHNILTVLLLSSFIQIIALITSRSVDMNRAAGRLKIDSDVPRSRHYWIFNSYSE